MLLMCVPHSSIIRHFLGGRELGNGDAERVRPADTDGSTDVLAASEAEEPGPAPDGPPVRLCSTCRHVRIRPKPTLFSTAELQSPGGLKAHTEWQQQQKEHAQREAQLIATNGHFTYEPHHYAWCAAYTRTDLVERARLGDGAALAELMTSGGAVMNPVTGEISPVYALCLRINPKGACERHEPE